MKVTKRSVNIGMVAAGVIIAGAALWTATSNGSATSTGNAAACSTFWSWYNGSQSRTGPILSAYQSATSRQLVSDLQSVSAGLQGKVPGDAGNASANAAFAQSAADNVLNDCTNDGFLNPQS